MTKNGLRLWRGAGDLVRRLRTATCTVTLSGRLCGTWARNCGRGVGGIPGKQSFSGWAQRSQLEGRLSALGPGPSRGDFGRSHSPRWAMRPGEAQVPLALRSASPGLSGIYLCVPLSKTFETKRNNASCSGSPAAWGPSKCFLVQCEARSHPTRILPSLGTYQTLRFRL